ncbi:unnamed protein product [Phaedon cochleariae]|uniref:Protein dead ringer n=1 Tax=Phaedon cochleariae TaxID=80249 RepID=A0A9N9SKJ0_PHACE|nr:unnamed protein product [Phaedon cochleariae]
MAKSVLDLYELYNLVIARGGLVDVINKKLWQEIIKGLHLPSSITSAAFTLRTQYMKYLYPYECEKRRLSTPAELQAAIDGNRREGRRSSYGQYDSMHHPHHQQQQQQRSPHSHPHHLQMSPLSLVAQQQQQLAARMMGGGLGVQALHNGGAHHPSHPQPLGQPMNGGPLPGLAPSEFEARMMEYVKLLNKEIRSNSGTTAATPPRQGGDLSPPPPHPSSPLDQLEMSRMTLWNLYNNNQPPLEPQKEPINLSEPAVNNNTTFPHSGVNNTLSHSGGNNHLSHSGGNNKNNSLSGGGQIKREPESRESPPPPKRVSKEEEEDLVEEEEEEDEEDDEEEEDRRQRRGVKAKALSPTTNIKINTRGDSRSGDNSLVVSMELNGITYQGVLFAQNAPSSGRTALAS